MASWVLSEPVTWMSVTQLVLGQVRAHLGAAAHDAQEPRVDQRRHGALPVRDQIVVDGIRLQHDDLALGEQLGQHVARPERRDVARAEYERHARRASLGDWYAAAWVAFTSASLTPGSIQTSPVMPA